MANQEIHGSFNNLVRGWSYFAINGSPVVSGVSDDHDLDRGSDLFGFFLHEVSVLDWDRGVFVTLNHEQWSTVLG